MHLHLHSTIKGFTLQCAVGLAGLCGMAVQAGDWPEQLQLHGFATQGYILTTGNNYFGESIDGGSFDFRELGLNASWRFKPGLQFSAQAVSRLAGETDDGAIRLDFGFLDDRFLSGREGQMGIRLGRILNPLGLYLDTRDVAFARPSILLPQSIYFDVNRNLALSLDGAQLYGERYGERGNVSFQLQWGYPRVDDPDFERSIFFGSAPGDLESEPTWLARLGYESVDARLRFAISGGQVNVGYDPHGPGDALDSGRFRFEPLILSAQYNARYWDLTAEYARRPTSLRNFGPEFPDVGFTGESYYLQGTYRFAPRWEALLRYDVLYWDKEDRNGTAFAAVTGQPAYRRFAKDLTVGLRWNLTASFMLRTEFHYIDGTGWLSELENPIPSETERYWTLFSILGSYRF
ncbi:hypothetical protein ThidrDRAFT_0626 [Thiorhodococcus drewsii AZ1]|uniref:Phosphate-selective porin O and P n=1 Tax=Thiorhodococcus drewsii AZ1 TaxID=765913 RepID=G2DX65_9GAMM|nr:hypothetical protein [Thiorhodococcus drewsii]EGV33419.1 hypothetical protein ThidrDRAFT_0626 [Thiorhodococcus drewsii AZ1]